MTQESTTSSSPSGKPQTLLGQMAERLRKELQDSGRMVRRVEPLATDELEVFVIPKARRNTSNPESEPSAD